MFALTDQPVDFIVAAGIAIGCVVLAWGWRPRG